MADTTDVQTDDIGAVDNSTVQTETVLTGDTNSDTGGESKPPVDDTGGESKPPVEETGDEGDKIVPETYADFNLPEGMQLDEIALSEASPMFKELGLTQDQAQKVVDLYAKQIQAGEQKNIDAFNQLTSEWRTAAENDKEYGGDKFDENVKTAQIAISKFGTKELKQLLTDHGIGNHPEMIRFMVRVGHTLKEDVPGSSGSLSTPQADRVSILYPNDS